MKGVRTERKKQVKRNEEVLKKSKQSMESVRKAAEALRSEEVKRDSFAATRAILVREYLSKGLASN